MRTGAPVASATLATGPLRRWATLLTLIIAGEMAFVLPFVIARVFRPTLLEVFGLTNLQLGTAFSAYGVVAMAAYLLGGPLADRYPARGLITVALLTTALGGLGFAAMPGVKLLTVLYAFWGLTSILLFWAALIRATRQWGGDAAQGRAFGGLDGGRGLLAAVLASALVAGFAWLTPGSPLDAGVAERSVALQRVILICTALTVLSAALAWGLLPADPAGGQLRGASAWNGLAQVCRRPLVWWQALIVVCAYVGYKATDYFSLYAADVLGYDAVEAAWLATLSFWMRPLAAIGAGLVADRIEGSRTLIGGFALMALGAGVLATGNRLPGATALLAMTVIVTSVGVYAVRALYYAIMGEARLPLSVTGAAVGLVSVLGYTPDIFAGPLFGYLLDGAPGVVGHQRMFAVIAGFAVLGMAASMVFRRLRPVVTQQTPTTRA